MSFFRYKVSIIVPIYNSSNYLEKCIKSLLGQTLDNVEFIFIDDCSSDNSLAVLEYELSKYPLFLEHVVIYKNLENKGVAAVRNIGLKLSQGEYIGWVDSDDWVELDMFKKLYNKAQSEGADIVWCDFTNVFDNNKHHVTQKCLEGKMDCIRLMIDGKLFGGMCNKLIKKSLYIDNGVCFPEGFNVCEDLRVNVQLFYFANKISYLADSLYNYVKYRSDSLSNTAAITFNVQFEWIENVKWVIEFLKRRNIKIETLNLDLFKLQSKKNLLIKGDSVKILKEWRSIFPEANYAVWRTDYPFIYKVLSSLIKFELWFLIMSFIFIKYKVLSVK